MTSRGSLREEELNVRFGFQKGSFFAPSINGGDRIMVFSWYFSLIKNLINTKIVKLDKYS
jgi:hypothetical protein